jgi:hypothetical protein
LNLLVGVNTSLSPEDPFGPIDVEVVLPADAPEGCPDAQFVPARNVYVCNVEAEVGEEVPECPCPKQPFGSWFSFTANAECAAFVTEAGVNGQCLATPIVGGSGITSGCRISVCPCPKDDGTTVIIGFEDNEGVSDGNISFVAFDVARKAGPSRG